MRRNEYMTFTVTYKEALALKQELQDGEDNILSQKVTVPASGFLISPTAEGRAVEAVTRGV